MDSNARRTAQTTRLQLGVMGLGVVGAHKIEYDANGALTFKARLHFKDQSRVRVMRVLIALNASDTYDIRVVRPDMTVVEFASGVYADQLTETMYRLDAEGVEK